MPGLAREALRAGSIAGLAMIPFGALFRAFGLRINEYGRKTLELVVGDVAPPLHFALSFAQHMAISCAAALPLLWLLPRLRHRRDRVVAGTLYGAAFYVAVNSIALPVWFGDPTPWQIGATTVLPSLVVHLVYGAVLGFTARCDGEVRP